MPQPGDAFGRYQITSRIGRGGMGVVFSARQLDLNREVALKLLSPELADSEEYRQRFVREAATLAQLDSSHVITVHDAGEQDGWLYIATQLIPGGDLARRLEEGGPLAPMLALDLMSQAAEGLADAHEAGIIHRDLKPSNILLRYRADGAVSAYICDLGIARVEASEHTKTTGVIGTLGYMAPERHNGQPANAATDIYSMGCLLWAVLSGRAPYVGTDLAVALGHLQEPIPQLHPSAPGAEVFNQLLLTSMSKSPEGRFHTARALKAALDGATRTLAGTPAAANPAYDSTVYRPSGPQQNTPHPHSNRTPTPTPTPTPHPQSHRTPTPTPHPTQRAPQFEPLPPARLASPSQPPRAQFEPLAPARRQATPARPVPRDERARGRRKAPWIILLVLLLLIGGGLGTWALVVKAKNDRIAPVADAVTKLSGVKLSYTLGSDSASCVGETVLDKTGATDSKALAADLSDSWPNLSSEDANIVAGAVLDCSPDVYSSLVEDVIQKDSGLDGSCVRSTMTDAEMRSLLAEELSGSGDSVQDDLDTLLADCRF